MKDRKQNENRGVRSDVMRKWKWQRPLFIVFLALAASIVSRAQSSQTPQRAVHFKTLVNFNGADGESPYPAPVQGFDGNLYGTTVVGGTSGLGTFFKMTPAGALTTIYSFSGLEQLPSGVTLGFDGNFYGAGGTVFQITPAGALTTFHTFCADPPNCTDGDYSYSTVAQGADGSFYGVTVGGGVNTAGPCSDGVYGVGCGTVFKLTPERTFTTIYNFCSQLNCADGAGPVAALVLGDDGELYGTTPVGGEYGYGTIFRITPSGTLTTLHSFNGTDGSFYPYEGFPLTHAANGYFYGTTLYGGATGNGTIFEISSDGAFNQLYSFCSQINCTDSANPAGIVQGTDGNFYGATSPVSTINFGTLFEMTPDRALTTLHTFDNTDGSGPASPTQATSGILYGVTGFGGTSNACGGCGTVFALSVGLGPFVETLPTLGKVGRAIKILGSNLTGATAVTFNGTAAEFKVGSKTLIEATVPAGATSGEVEVVVPAGTLKSNTRFVIRP